MPLNEPSAQRIPHIGDIVLYHHFDAGRLFPLAAMVTHVEREGDPRSPLHLTVFRSGRPPEFHHSGIPFAEEPTNGYWGWREGD